MITTARSSLFRMGCPPKRLQRAQDAACRLPAKICGPNPHDRGQVTVRLSAGFGTPNVKAGLFAEQDMRVQIRVLAVASVIGAAALGAVPAVSTSGPTNALGGCGAGYYENSMGNVPDPSSGLPPRRCPRARGRRYAAARSYRDLPRRRILIQHPPLRYMLATRRRTTVADKLTLINVQYGTWDLRGPSHRRNTR